MKTLFFKTLLSSVVSLIMFLVILAIFLFLGFDRSLDSWSSNKLEEIRNGVESLLIDRDAEVKFPENISVFVYDTNQNLIYSNRGEGRRRSFSPDGDVERVVVNGELIGYYHIGNIAFQNDYANQQFISSMTRVLWIGALISCVLSILYAFVFSRSIAKPAIAVAGGIRAIAEGSLDRAIPEEGAVEIAGIAHAANDLRAQLKKERLLRLQWAQDVAHDLRTPISALKAQFEGISDGVLPLSMGRIEQNLGEIHRVELLINDLQELMQLENPELVPTLSDLNLKDLLAEIAAAFSFKMVIAEATCIVDASDIVLSADEDLLHRAISNVLSNAVRHVNPGGRIVMAAAFPSGDGSEAPKGRNAVATITIRNSGKPIPEDEIDKVFERLFRGDHARHTPGTGLGLTIARQIVELHGGTIGVSSDSGNGTAVTIRLPAV